MLLEIENFERVVDVATDNGFKDCRIEELQNYLDTIIDSCRLSFRDTLDIDSDILTTILKTYSKCSVNKKIKEIKEEKEKMLIYTLESESEKSE